MYASLLIISYICRAVPAVILDKIQQTSLRTARFS